MTTTSLSPPPDDDGGGPDRAMVARIDKEDTMKHAKHAHFDPTEYGGLFWYYLGPLPEADSGWQEEMLRKAEGVPAIIHWMSEHLGTMPKCDHCGTRHYYGAVAIHKPTGDPTCFGNICAGEIFDCADRAEYVKRRMEKRVAAARKREKLRQKVAETLAGDPELAEAFQGPAKGHKIVADIRSKLERYGSLSDAQRDLVVKIHQEQKQYHEQHVAKLGHEPEPVVEGRRLVEGIVLSVKAKDGYYGPTLKMLVEEDGGSRVWGTVPSALSYRLHPWVREDGTPSMVSLGVEKGDRVAFRATITRSNDDPSFGFFKRPTNPEVLALGEKALEPFTGAAQPPRPDCWGETLAEAEAAAAATAE